MSAAGLAVGTSTLWISPPLGASRMSLSCRDESTASGCDRGISLRAASLDRGQGLADPTEAPNRMSRRTAEHPCRPRIWAGDTCARPLSMDLGKSSQVMEPTGNGGLCPNECRSRSLIGGS